MAANQIGNLEVGVMRTDQSGAFERRRSFSGRPAALGARPHDQCRPGADGRRAGSLTWAGLFNTYYWIDPATKIAGVIMMQILPFVDRQALVAYRQFERGIYHALGGLKSQPRRTCDRMHRQAAADRKHDRPPGHPNPGNEATMNPT